MKPKRIKSPLKKNCKTGTELLTYIQQRFDRDSHDALQHIPSATPEEKLDVGKAVLLGLMAELRSAKVLGPQVATVNYQDRTVVVAVDLESMDVVADPELGFRLYIPCNEIKSKEPNGSTD